MKLRPVFLVLVIAAIFPSLTLCQNQQYMNCHTQESSGNFVASNETIVNGMVCQIAKPKSTVVASSTPGTTPKPSRPVGAPLSQMPTPNAVVPKSLLILTGRHQVARS